MTEMLFWILKWHSPQLGVYYFACGQMTKSAANKRKAPLYGSNVMLSFATEEEYNAAIERLTAAGERVQGGPK